MKNPCLILLFVLFQLSVNAQSSKDIIIKTKPYQLIVANNPVIGIEKAVSKILSVEVEFMYLNRSWNTSGGEYDFGKYYDGDGFRIIAGTRVYFGRAGKYLEQSNQKALFGWFGSMQLGYSQSLIYSIEKRGSVSGLYQHTAEVKKNRALMNISIGRQFWLFKTITMELYLGPTIYFPYTETTTITNSSDSSEIGTSTSEFYTIVRGIRPNFVFTLGYCF